MENSQPQNRRPAGNKVTVGAIPGAIILTNEVGEVIAITPGAAKQVIKAIRDLLPFAKKTKRYEDDLRIPAPPVFYPKQ